MPPAPFAIADAVWGFWGVMVGGLLGFLGSLAGGFLLRRQEVLQQARLDIVRIHLPALNSIPYEDPATTMHINGLVTACMLLGDVERDLGERLSSAYTANHHALKRLNERFTDERDQAAIAAATELSRLVEALVDRVRGDLTRGLSLGAIWSRRS
jgi:hypothetical protein